MNANASPILSEENNIESGTHELTKRNKKDAEGRDRDRFFSATNQRKKHKDFRFINFENFALFSG